MRKFILMATCISALAISGCTLSKPSQVSMDRIKIDQTMETITLDRHQITPQSWARITDDYKKAAEGGMRVFVSYPDDIAGAEAEATVLAREYEHILRARGVSDFEVVTVPSDYPGYDHRVLVSYKGYKANSPENCSRITGHHGAENLYESDEYRIGCENMRAFSKMVSDPRDLLGRSKTQDGDSRRAGAVVERYRSGEPLEPLEATTASGIGE